jgi:hypothetical protein
VHRSFLSAHSEYFRAALEGSYEEAKTSTVNLKDVDAPTFDIFVGWLYSQQITTAVGDVPEFYELVKLWIFADFAQVPRLQNQVLISMNQRPGHLTDDPQICFETIYKNTVPKSPLRTYIVSSLAKSQLAPEVYPREMLVDVVNSIGRQKREKSSKFTNAEMEEFLVDDAEVSHSFSLGRLFS